jgi:hypothetical protein
MQTMLDAIEMDTAFTFAQSGLSKMDEIYSPTAPVSNALTGDSFNLPSAERVVVLASFTDRIRSSGVPPANCGNVSMARS